MNLSKEETTISRYRGYKNRPETVNSFKKEETCGNALQHSTALSLKHFTNPWQ